MSTLENFELTQWLSLHYFVYLVGLHQIRNSGHLQRFKNQNKYRKKVSLVYVVHIF